MSIPGQADQRRIIKFYESKGLPEVRKHLQQT
jgi:hypothetical protein